MKKMLLLLVPVLMTSCGSEPRDKAAQSASAVVESKESANPGVQSPLSTGNAAVKGAPPLTLSVSSLTASTGENICVDIATADFREIISMQYSLRWDKDVLEFQEVRGFGLPFLSHQNFGAHRVKEGILTFVWIDNNLKGIDLPDGSAIFKVCFLVKGRGGQSTSVAFSPQPTPFEVVNVREEVLPLNGVEGSVSVR
jgi:hypothetical protein